MRVLMRGLVTILGIFIASVCIFVMILALEGPAGPIRHAITRSSIGYPPQRAVEASNEENWPEALKEAGVCAARMKSGAQVQQQLEKEGTPAPMAAGMSGREVNEIMRRGTLNSLAHCSLLAGEAAERLGNHQDALRWFEAASHLTYARVYDPKERIFWSPAERAGHAMAGLSRQMKNASVEPEGTPK